MNYTLNHVEIRDAVSKLCLKFDGKYWQNCDKNNSYPTEFVNALTEAGYLSALIPEEYGGLGLSLSVGELSEHQFLNNGLAKIGNKTIELANLPVLSKDTTNFVVPELGEHTKLIKDEFFN